MKRSNLIFLVAGLVLLTTTLWMVAVNGSAGWADLVQFGVIALLVAFALWLGFTRLKSERRGEPAEDEMSKRIMTRASSVSFYISIYLWLALMYINDKGSYESDLVFGTGILGMGVIFAVSWLVVYWRGVRNG